MEENDFGNEGEFDKQNNNNHDNIIIDNGDNLSRRSNQNQFIITPKEIKQISSVLIPSFIFVRYDI